MGSHACGFCAQAVGIGRREADMGRGRLPSGSTNILIPGRAVVYVIPSSIVHYIEEHQYCPPTALSDVEDVCPPMWSRRYFLALMAAGGDMPGLG
jgi:hypothetical protein